MSRPLDAAAGLVASALVLALSLPAVALAAPADEPAAGPGRPKVCLVLSGGGARGAAHIGVLKVLDEYRVPIDCIAGTSMGAIVGGAYATGMRVDEMSSITHSISTELLLKEKPPREERSMRRKADDYGLFFTPDLGYKDGEIGLGKGIVTGVQLEAVLRQLSKVRGFHRFDNLPIPYRAVATDLVTGKPVVFSEGEMANVMRASMSVPGAVAPAEFDGMMMVDGMLTANLPVEVARELRPDVIIAVNVGTPLLKREQLDGVLGISAQMLSILTEQNVQASLARLKPDDILISPELGDFTTADFDRLPEIAPLGEAAARQVADRLARLSLPAAQYAALRERQSVELKPDLRPVDEIRFATLNEVNPRTARAAMDTETGKPIDQATLDRDMRRLYGTGNFEHVHYRYLEEPNRRVLAVDAIEKSWGLDYLRLGLGLSSDFQGDAYFNLIGSYRNTWINSLGAEWRTDVQIGRSSSLMTEFYQPLIPEGTFFVAPRIVLENRSTDLYQGENRVASYDVSSALAALDFGSLIGRYGEVRLGLAGGIVQPELDTGPQLLSPGPERTVGAATFQLLLDRLDSVHFPRYGWRGAARVFASTDALGADENYTKWDTEFTGAYSLGEHTFQLGLKFGGALGSDPLPNYDLFQWGGFVQQSGYATGQLLGQNLSYARLMYYHRILRSSLFEGAYGGGSIEIGEVGDPLVQGSPTGRLFSGSLFVASDTPVGPAYLGYGRADDGNGSWYFYLGRPF